MMYVSFYEKLTHRFITYQYRAYKKSISKNQKYHNMDNCTNETKTLDNTDQIVVPNLDNESDFEYFKTTATLTDSQPDIDSWFEEENSKAESLPDKETSENCNPIKFVDTCSNSSVNTEENPHVEVVYVEDIVNEDIHKLESNKLIQYECCVSYFIQLLLEGVQNHRIRTSKKHDQGLTTDKIKDVVFYLQWISNVSEYLADKIEQPLIESSSTSKSYGTSSFYDPFWRPPIIRSSYNFCREYTNCKKFYNKNELPSCTEHHYVHSLLKYDIDSIIGFLNFILKNDLTLSENEMNNVHLSIKTICFVTRHMAEEISYIDYITKNNSECYHRSNPVDFLRRRGNMKYPRRKYSDDGTDTRYSEPVLSTPATYYRRDRLPPPDNFNRSFSNDNKNIHNPLSHPSDKNSHSERYNHQDTLPTKYYNYYNPKKNNPENVPNTDIEPNKKKKSDKKKKDNSSNRFMLLSEC